MKRFLASLIRSILVVAVFSVLLSAAMLVPVKEEETVDPEVTLSADADFLKEDIYLDGSIKYNWKLASPVGTTGDTVYIPLDISGFEGIKEAAEEEPEKGVARPVGHAEGNSIVLDAYDLSEDGEAPEEEPSEPEDPAEARAERFGGIKISLEDGETRHEFSGFSGTRGFKGLKGVFLSGNDDILLCDDGTYYGSLDFVKNYLGVDCVYSPGAGLYLSTDPAVPAQLYADADTNPSYEKGAVAYIMAVNRNLSEETAVWYEYLIRHVAGQYKHMTPEMVTGIIYVESRFRPDVGSNAGAVGLMQVLVKYARVRGYTLEMILDPHINIEYGTDYMETLINMYGGDVTAGLAAYNMGPAYVRSGGDYNRRYPEAVFARMDEFRNWLSSNGYSNSFKEQIELPAAASGNGE